jgi:hypothetical protein
MAGSSAAEAAAGRLVGAAPIVRRLGLVRRGWSGSWAARRARARRLRPITARRGRPRQSRSAATAARSVPALRDHRVPPSRGRRPSPARRATRLGAGSRPRSAVRPVRWTGTARATPHAPASPSSTGGHAGPPRGRGRAPARPARLQRPEAGARPAGRARALAPPAPARAVPVLGHAGPARGGWPVPPGAPPAASAGRCAARGGRLRRPCAGPPAARPR